MSNQPQGPRTSVPLTADQLEMLGCALSLLAGESSWAPDPIKDLSDLLAEHQRFLRRSIITVEVGQCL